MEDLERTPTTTTITEAVKADLSLKKTEGDATRNIQKDEEKDTPGEMKNPCGLHDGKQRVERI